MKSQTAADHTSLFPWEPEEDSQPPGPIQTPPSENVQLELERNLYFYHLPR